MTVVKEGKLLLKRFEGAEKLNKEYDITKKINLNPQAKNVYSVAIRILKDFFVDDSQELERIIKLFHEKLISFFSGKNK